MSYSERHVREVPYSGTAHYTFPASEHGGSGTVSYSGSVSVGININVDTDPFDSSVADTKNSLDKVAVAVSAAEAAQVATIQQSSRRIVESVTQGFFGVLANEVSAHISEAGSAMKSIMGLLLEQAAAIENVHRQMNSDYNNIKARYTRIFDELDRELDRRIKELDRSAFQLSERSMQGVVSRPVVESAAHAFMQMSETSTVPLKLQCATAKSRASDILRNMGDVCDMITTYTDSVASVVDTAATDEQVAMIPVVYAIEQDLATNQPRALVCQNADTASDSIRSSILQFVSSQPESKWTPPREDHREALDEGFVRRVENYGTDKDGSGGGLDRERVCRMMLELYQQANTKTVYTG